MTTDRHRAIRAALVDAGVPIDRADEAAATLAADEEPPTPDRWLADALADRRRRTPTRLRMFTDPTPDDDPPPPDAA